MARPSFIKRGSTRQSEETFDDDLDDRDDSKRRYRNLSEKKRRDQFNVLVNELNSMVSTNSRKMDKSTVLQSTISFLRNYNEITVKSRVHEIQDDWKPVFLSNVEFSHLILEALDGFILVFSTLGAILYASESITALLGHIAIGLVNTSVYDLVHKTDHTQLYNILLSPDNMNKAVSNDHQVSLVCHMKHCSSEENKPTTYELVQFQGHFRQEQEREGSYDTRLVFIGIGKLLVPQLIKDLPFVDSSKNEFTSRHSLEWKFLFLDHRASPIIGYLPFEVLGTSGYDYYHVDDLDKVVECHQALMQKGEGTSCHYRFLMKGQQWIWLQTRFYITYHQWTSKPEFIACSHRVVSYKDVLKPTFDLTKNEHENGESLTKLWSNKTASLDGGSWQSKPETGKQGVSNTWASQQDASKPGVSNTWTNKPDASKPGVSNTWASQLDGSKSGVTNTWTNKQDAIKPGLLNTWPSQQDASKQGLSNTWANKQDTSKLGVSNTWTSRSKVTKEGASKILVQSETASMDSRHSQLTTRSNASTLHRPQPVDYVSVIPSAAPPGIVMTTAQSLAQDHLQRKHQHLQQLINMQQQELRLVSEQLLMAKYNAAHTAVGSSTALSPLPISATQLYSPGSTSGLGIDQTQVHGHSEAEMFLYQLSQQQAQVLFTSPDTTTHSDL